MATRTDRPGAQQRVPEPDPLPRHAHPSAIPRTPPEERDAARAALVADLKIAAGVLIS